MNALNTCNVCDAEVKTPNEAGYCDEHLAEVRKPKGTTQHTPGPWKAVENYIYGNHTRDTAQRVAIVDRKEDTRLIAAAPEMLGELIKHRDWLRHIRQHITAPKNILLGFDQADKYISAAINKAEGR